MLRYSAFGLAIDSEIDLGDPQELIGSADVVIRIGDTSGFRGKTTLCEEFVRVGSAAEFHIVNGNRITVSVGPESPAGVVRVLLRGRIMAFLLRQRGWLPLHASGVRIGDKAVLFLAPVGGGKSTTAAAFAAAGHEILTDDVAPAKVIAGQTVLCTGPTQIRLCEDAAESFRELDPAAVFLFDKRAFRVAAPVSPHEIPLTAVCLLSDGPDIALTRLSPLEATMALGRECFIRLHRAGSEVRLAHLRQSAEVAAITPVFRLTRPRSLARLGEVVEAVSGTLSWSIIHQR